MPHPHGHESTILHSNESNKSHSAVTPSFVMDMRVDVCTKLMKMNWAL